jgi:hypothetical protein
MSGSIGVPSGHVFRVERKRGPVWYATYRLPSGQQVQKKLAGSTIRVRAGWAAGQLTTPMSGNVRAVPLATALASLGRSVTLSFWALRTVGWGPSRRGPSRTSLPIRVGRSGGQGSRVSGGRSAGRRPDLDGCQGRAKSRPPAPVEKWFLVGQEVARAGDRDQVRTRTRFKRPRQRQAVASAPQKRPAGASRRAGGVAAFARASGSRRREGEMRGRRGRRGRRWSRPGLGTGRVWAGWSPLLRFVSGERVGAVDLGALGFRFARERRSAATAQACGWSADLSVLTVRTLALIPVVGLDRGADAGAGAARPGGRHRG